MPRQARLTFSSQGERLAAVLVTPDDVERPPVVIMGGGWCYVKEIVLPHYAKALVAAGAAVLMFDYRNVGESSGARRQHIDPRQQIEDHRNAITFLESRTDVDADRIGVWGISYAGGHVLVLAAIDHRVKLAVSNIPVVNGYETMRRVHGSTRFADLEALLLEDRRRRTNDPRAEARIPMSSLGPGNRDVQHESSASQRDRGDPKGLTHEPLRETRSPGRGRHRGGGVHPASLPCTRSRAGRPAKPQPEGEGLRGSCVGIWTLVTPQPFRRCQCALLSPRRRWSARTIVPAVRVPTVRHVPWPSTTGTGLRVHAHLIKRRSQTGTKITDAQMRALAITEDDQLPERSYSLSPA